MVWCLQFSVICCDFWSLSRAWLHNPWSFPFSVHIFFAIINTVLCKIFCHPGNAFTLVVNTRRTAARDAPRMQRKTLQTKKENSAVQTFAKKCFWRREWNKMSRKIRVAVNSFETVTKTIQISGSGWIRFEDRCKETNSQEQTDSPIFIVTSSVGCNLCGARSSAQKKKPKLLCTWSRIFLLRTR